MEEEQHALNGPASGFEDDDEDDDHVGGAGGGDDEDGDNLPPPDAFDGTVNLLAEGPNAAPIAHVDELDSSDENQSQPDGDDGPRIRHPGHIEIEAPVEEPPPPFHPVDPFADASGGPPPPLPDEVVVINEETENEEEEEDEDEEEEEEDDERDQAGSRNVNRDSVILAPSASSATSPGESSQRPPSLADVGQQKRIDFVDIGGHESPDRDEEVHIIENENSKRFSSISAASSRSLTRMKSPPPPQTSGESSNGDQEVDSVVEVPLHHQQSEDPVTEIEVELAPPPDIPSPVHVPEIPPPIIIESPPPPSPVVIVDNNDKPTSPVVAEPPPVPTAFEDEIPPPVQDAEDFGASVPLGVVPICSPTEHKLVKQPSVEEESSPVKIPKEDVPDRQVQPPVSIPSPQRENPSSNNVILCGEDVYQQVLKKPAKGGFNGHQQIQQPEVHLPEMHHQPQMQPFQQPQMYQQPQPVAPLVFQTQQYPQQPQLSTVAPVASNMPTQQQYRGTPAVTNVNAIVEVDPTARGPSTSSGVSTKVSAGKQATVAEDELPLTVHVDTSTLPISMTGQTQKPKGAGVAPVPTIVKMNPDGVSSHTEAARKPGRQRRHSGRLIQCGWSPGRVRHSVTPKNAKTAAFVVVSFVYAKLLLVACISFLLAEIVSYKIPLYFFEGFFTYLYGVSILFLLYVFCYLLQNGSRTRSKRSRKVASGSKLKVNIFQPGQSGTYNVSEYNREAEEAGMQKSGRAAEEGVAGGSPSQQKMTESLISTGKPHKFKTTINESTHGSFFLRIGAIVFGLGTLIYCGLELGAFFEVPMTSPCHDLVNGLNPALQMAFTFMQMYFIFMNAKLNIHKFKVVARFGLMHIIATNICVWLRTIVREGLKDFTKFYAEHFEGPSEDQMMLARGNMTLEEIKDKNMTCERVSIMGSIREDAAPYLYPIVVEYSLIAAVVLFVMWLHIGRNPRYICDDELDGGGGLADPSIVSVAATPKVDCVGASKGLFIGLLLLICAMIATILFFILIENDDFHQYAMYLADSAHSGLLFFSLLAVLFGFCRVKKLKFNPEKEDLLNALCLRISAFGILLYGTFTTIAGAVKFLNPVLDIPCLLVLITGSLTILEAALQVLFVSDASKRAIHKPELNLSRPGRQLVTVLLLANITMWGIYTFEAQKVERLPVQINFYGSLPWAVLVKLTLPLCIFHRFHASVVLADIWKNGYKPKLD